jgi:hypothetical protein
VVPRVPLPGGGAAELGSFGRPEGVSVGKRERRFERIAEFRERFQKLPTDTIRRRLNTGMLQPEAAIALREVLEEREQVSDSSVVPEAEPGAAVDGGPKAGRRH